VSEEQTQQLFSLEDKVAVVTGGTGVLGGAIARGLSRAGAKVGVLGRRARRAATVAEAIEAEGGPAMPLVADVLERAHLDRARDIVMERWGGVDILINAAGGNLPGATVVGDLTFFDLTEDAVQQVLRLNLYGSVLPSQVFGQTMVERGGGSIINISSMAAQRALTRVVAYGAAKAAIDNVTKWLAVELARAYSPAIRVNAIAPGFFVGDQNRALLLREDGTPTERGQRIIDHTPMGRFGEPDELIGAAVWLASDAARFVTGIVVPVDGGYSAFGGV
jgi:NAD(P)-dependent dehydrogenase (short-subunit alcohol dehydrogenase family)